MVVQIIVTWQ